MISRRRASCRAGSISRRVAVEPPRDPAHGDLATNAAMVLAGAVKQNPLALAERIAAALAGRELASGDYRGRGFTVAAARPGFINIRLAPEVWHAQLRAILRAGTAFGDSRSAAASGSMSSSSRPIRPGRCMSGTAAAPSSAMRWPALLTKAGFAVASRILRQRRRRPGRRARPLAPSALSRGAGRRGRADPRGAVSRRLSDRHRPRACRARRARNGSARPEARVAAAGPRLCRRGR